MEFVFGAGDGSDSEAEDSASGNHDSSSGEACSDEACSDEDMILDESEWWKLYFYDVKSVLYYRLFMSYFFIALPLRTNSNYL